MSKVISFPTGRVSGFARFEETMMAVELTLTQFASPEYIYKQLCAGRLDLAQAHINSNSIAGDLFSYAHTYLLYRTLQRDELIFPVKRISELDLNPDEMKQTYAYVSNDEDINALNYLRYHSSMSDHVIEGSLMLASTMCAFYRTYVNNAIKHFFTADIRDRREAGSVLIHDLKGTPAEAVEFERLYGGSCVCHADLFIEAFSNTVTNGVYSLRIEPRGDKYVYMAEFPKKTLEFTLDKETLECLSRALLCDTDKRVLELIKIMSGLSEEACAMLTLAGLMSVSAAFPSEDVLPEGSVRLDVSPGGHVMCKWMDQKYTVIRYMKAELGLDIATATEIFEKNS